MTATQEAIRLLEEIEAGNKKQGEALVTATKAMEEAVNQIHSLVQEVREMDFENRSYAKTNRIQILQSLYAATSTLSKAAADMRFTY